MSDEKQPESLGDLSLEDQGEIVQAAAEMAQMLYSVMRQMMMAGGEAVGPHHQLAAGLLLVALTREIAKGGDLLCPWAESVKACSEASIELGVAVEEQMAKDKAAEDAKKAAEAKKES